MALKVTRGPGMVLLAIWLIVTNLPGLGTGAGDDADVITSFLALIAGVLILVG